MNDKKTVSVSEFKNWLTGVLDFQPEDWVPDSGQWEKILNKIMQLDERSGVPDNRPVAPVEAAPVISTPQTKQAPAARNPRPVGPMDQQPAVPLPEVKPREKHVTVQKSSSPQVIEGQDGNRVIDTGTVHKMGNIDTSDKDYTSSFV